MAAAHRHGSGRGPGPGLGLGLASLLPLIATALCARLAAGAHYGWRPAGFQWKALATARGGGGGRVALPAEAALHALVCTACGDGDDSGGNDILLCDGAECSTAMHMRCLQPPLKAVPKGKWYCPECAAERKELRVARKRARLEVISGAPSEYEVQRLHNIAQNKQKLQMLGLEGSGSTVNSTSTGTR